MVVCICSCIVIYGASWSRLDLAHLPTYIRPVVCKEVRVPASTTMQTYTCWSLSYIWLDIKMLLLLVLLLLLSIPPPLKFVRLLVPSRLSLSLEIQSTWCGSYMVLQKGDIQKWDPSGPPLVAATAGNIWHVSVGLSTTIWYSISICWDQDHNENVKSNYGNCHQGAINWFFLATETK